MGPHMKSGKAKGREQGDPLMPMLYALGQHQALLAVQSQLLPNERLMAFHDDVHAVSVPERTCNIAQHTEAGVVGSQPHPNQRK